MWNHQSHVLIPLSSPQALHSQSSSSLSVFQSLCSTSSVVDSSGGIYCQFLFPPRVRMPPPLFLILPLVLTPLPCFFCFFLLLSSALVHPSFFVWLLLFAFFETFSSYIGTCLSLFNRPNFATTRGYFCFG